MTTYSHRNGETDPPTEEGRYWLEGKLAKGQRGGHPWYIEFGDGWGDPLPYYVFPRGNQIHLDRDYTEPLDRFEGRFWGPVEMPVPPWEQPNA